MSALSKKWYTQEEYDEAFRQLFPEDDDMTVPAITEQRILLNRAAEILKDREDGCFCDANDCAACLKSQSLLTQIKGVD